MSVSATSGSNASGYTHTELSIPKTSVYTLNAFADQIASDSGTFSKALKTAEMDINSGIKVDSLTLGALQTSLVNELYLAGGRNQQSGQELAQVADKVLHLLTSATSGQATGAISNLDYLAADLSGISFHAAREKLDLDLDGFLQGNKGAINYTNERGDAISADADISDASDLLNSLT